MRTALIGLAGLLLIAGCSKAPGKTDATSATSSPAGVSAAAATPAAAAALSGPAVSGTFTGNGKAAILTQATAHPDDPFDGKPVTAVVLTEKDQGGDPKAAFNAVFNHFGDAIVIKIQPDGTVIGADVVHSGLKTAGGSVSISGVFTLKDYSTAGGQISGHLTSGGPTDVFGQKLDVDLTFHAKAP